MADQSMGRSMANRDCEWVRARLPLWVGDGNDDQNGSPREGGDLAAKDGREIDQHVGGCTSCRIYRSSLEEAMAALLAAAHVPVEPAASSLWPVLQRRIASHNAYIVSRWRGAASCVADRWVRARTILDREQPLRLGWIHDTLREALIGPKHHGLESNRKSRMVLRYGIMSLLSVALIGGLVLGREWTDSQSMIVANAAPLTNQVPPNTVHEEPSDLANPDMGGEESPSQLAEADLARTPEASGSGLDGAGAAKPPSPTRLGYDLDHGTPIAPDTRDSRPVY
jgi:hypothetical protein